MPFHNPYNFLPARRRDDGRMPEGLRDAAPPGHHRWHPDLLSGHIDVEMTTITPLLAMRPREEVDGHQHLDVAVTTGPDGAERVDVPASSVKGMLRAAFEAVTNSRLAVFDHPDRLGYRSDVADALRLRPALVHSATDVEILGSLVLNNKQSPAVAAVPAWDHDGDNRRWQLPAFHHRQDVEAVISWRQAGNRSGWRIETLLSDDEEQQLSEPGDDWYHVRGVLLVTGPTIKAKKAERLFITGIIEGHGELTQQRSRRITGDDARRLTTDLRDLISHQVALHQHAGTSDVEDRDGHRPWEYLGHEPGRTAWSRHLYAADATAPPWTGYDTTTPGDAHPAPLNTASALPCWLDTLDRGRDRLRPVMVSRLLHHKPPADLLHPSLHPATSLAECSPADRVFGWTHPEGTGAHRAQLRVTTLTCPTRDAVHRLEEPLTLPPLSAPKPSQGRFYLTDIDARPIGPSVPKAELFTGKQQIRGRKVYPHQQWMEHASTAEILTRARYTPPEGRPAQDTQNATIHSWVRAGAQFTFTLEFQDLHPLELGALLWLLDPHRIGEPATPGRLRLGWGKPFGFGAVAVTATTCAVQTGAQAAQSLRTLHADHTVTTDAAPLIEDFAACMDPAVLAGFRSAAIGYPTADPVHYPRTSPDSAGYVWFVANDKQAAKGAAQSLPSLGGPMLREKP